MFIGQVKFYTISIKKEISSNEQHLCNLGNVLHILIHFNIKSGNNISGITLQ